MGRITFSYYDDNETNVDISFEETGDTIDLVQKFKEFANALTYDVDKFVVGKYGGYGFLDIEQQVNSKLVIDCGDGTLRDNA